MESKILFILAVIVLTGIAKFIIFASNEEDSKIVAEEQVQIEAVSEKMSSDEDDLKEITSSDATDTNQADENEGISHEEMSPEISGDAPPSADVDNIDPKL